MEKQKLYVITKHHFEYKDKTTTHVADPMWYPSQPSDYASYDGMLVGIFTDENIANSFLNFNAISDDTRIDVPFNDEYHYHYDISLHGYYHSVTPIESDVVYINGMPYINFNHSYIAVNTLLNQKTDLESKNSKNLQVTDVPNSGYEPQ